MTKDLGCAAYAVGFFIPLSCTDSKEDGKARFISLANRRAMKL